MTAVRVLFFGPARDLAGVDEVGIELADGSTVADLKAALAEAYPEVGRAMQSIRFAVNESFAKDGHGLQSGDDIALIPPVSGGGPDIWVDFVSGPIPVERVRSFVTGDPGLGGIVTFEGATRAEEDDAHGRLLRLDYEAYESMALKQLTELAERAVEAFAAGRVAIVHRLGAVALGEASVMIAVACEHRAEAFDACRFLIDALKRDVPIWKKDVFADGFVRWVKP